MRRPILYRLLGYARPYWVHLATTVVVSGSSAFIGLVPPYLTKILIDDVLLLGGSRRLLLALVGGLLAVELLSALVSVGQTRLNAWLGGRITLDVRGQLYQHLQRLSLRFHDRQQVGTLMARITQDAGSMQGFLSSTLPGLLVNLLTFIGVFAVTFTLNARMTLLALIPGVFLTLGGTIFWRRMWPRQREVWERWGRLNSLLNNALSGIRVVKAFAQEDRQSQAFKRESEALFRADMNVQWATSAFMPLMGLAGTAATLLVWGLGGSQIQTGQLTLGTLMAFLAYLGRLQGPVHFLANVPATYSGAHVGAQRIFEILDATPEPYDDPRAVPLGRARGEIDLVGVTFGYDSQAPVLHEIDLHVRPGELIGIVGHTGAGKTSLINLVCRFYDPDLGAVRLDGQDLRQLRLGDLRRQISMVPQDPFLFDLSIAANLGYARPEADRRQLIEVAHRAGAHEFITGLPDGYDTRVGERGVRLSGGERQRLALARALLPDPAILILDEATSAVDSETEQRIQEGIAAVVRGRTTLVIAHRLSTLQQADRLVVLAKGEKVEEGTHRELLEKGGVYARLLKLQRLDREGSAATPGQPRDTRLRWLAGESLRLRRGSYDGLTLLLPEDPIRHDTIEVIRAFPLSAPEGFLVFREINGRPIGVLADSGDLDEVSRRVLAEDLEWRYGYHWIVRIEEIHDGGETLTWRVETEDGTQELLVDHPRDSVREILPGRLRVVDRFGNRFGVLTADLDRRSLRLLRESRALSHAVFGSATMS